MVDLAGQPCFFVRAVVGLGIGKTVGLAIDGAILMGTDIAVGFLGCFCGRR